MQPNAMPDAEGSLDAPAPAPPPRESEGALELEVEAILARALPAVDLRELTVLGGRAGRLRVVVDHPEGVDHGLCADVTQALEAGGLLQRYGIEVWSPGPEPPLRTERHFRGAVGQRVRVEVADDSAPRGRRAHVGTLTGAEGGTLTIAGEDARETAIHLSAVRRARIAEANVPGSTG